MTVKKFHTQYDAAELGNAHKVYDTNDNVDRVSYVDSSVMVKRFILEGRSLAEARALALRSGSYNGNLNEIVNDNGIAIPVYPVDSVIADKMIKSASERFGTPDVSDSNATTINDDAKRSDNSGVTGASSATV